MKNIVLGIICSAAFFPLLVLIELFPPPQILALSTSFIRQEVTDNKSDISSLTGSPINQNSTLGWGIDITGVSYVSDGKFLNATLWLSEPANGSNYYSMGIDADSDLKTGWAGMDYQVL